MPICIPKREIWTKQPQYPVGIAWSNQLSGSLVSAYTASTTKDAARGADARYYNGVISSSNGLLAKDDANYVAMYLNQKASIVAGSNLTVVFSALASSLAGNNPGFLREGTGVLAASAAGNGTSFFILQGTSFRPWIRLGGVDILKPASGAALELGKHYNIAYRVVHGQSAAVAWNGVIQHTVTHGQSVGNMDFQYVGAQSTSDERVGPIGLFLLFARALTDAELISITSNPWQIFAP